MNIIEHLHCIQYLNPEASCVVWEGNKVIYDKSHKGDTPTIAECKKVLKIIQAEIVKENETINQIKSIEKEITNLAIESLKNKGELPTDY